MTVAVMFSAMVVAAVIIVVMIMAVAVCIRSVLEFPCGESFGSFICRSAYARTESDSCIGNGHLGTHSDSAADEDIGFILLSLHSNNLFVNNDNKRGFVGYNRIKFGKSQRYLNVLYQTCFFV